MYRYRDNYGATRQSITALKHLYKIGTPIEVRGYCHKGKFNNRLAVLVKGDKGSARFSAFCWGYFGEGPRGLLELFKKICVPSTVAEHIAHNIPNPNWEKPRVYWSLDLSIPGEYTLRERWYSPVAA
jgi:hypothetical protein